MKRLHASELRGLVHWPLGTRILYGLSATNVSMHNYSYMTGITGPLSSGRFFGRRRSAVDGQKLSSDTSSDEIRLPLRSEELA